MARTRVWIAAAALLALLAGNAQAGALGGTSRITLVNGQVDLVIPVIVASGGTGATTLTAHGVLMGETTSPLAASAAGTSGNAFLSGGAGADGAYGALDLSATANTTAAALPISRGGTNSTAGLANSKCIRSSGGALVEAAGDCATPVNPVLWFASTTGIAQGSGPFFFGFGGNMDTAEGNVQFQVGAHSFKNMRCINTAIQGTANNIVVISRLGACGSQADGTVTCTITGTTGANQSCSDTTNTSSPTAGQCIDFKATIPATLTANAFLNCTVEESA